MDLKHCKIHNLFEPRGWQ